MIEINLVPDVKQELIRAQRARALVVSFSILAGIISLGVVVLLLFYVYVGQGFRDRLANDAIDDRSQDLAEIEDLPKVLTIQNQLASLKILNETKKVDSRLFDLLAAVIPPAPNQVLISTLTLDAETSTLFIEGETPTYDTLETFKKTIDGAEVHYTVNGQDQTKKLAEEISMSDISFGEDTDGLKTVRFTIQFKYPPEFFLASVPSVVIKLTNAGNATDSYLGIPKSIFVTTGGNQ